jgi:hypothetical protein
MPYLASPQSSHRLCADISLCVCHAACRPPTAGRSAPQAVASSSSSSSQSTESGAASGGVSERLKAANKALVEKIRALLPNDSQFSEFKAESGAFMRGDVPARTFHARMVSLGLLSLAAELAALCPVPERRETLLEAHKAHLAAVAAGRSSSSTSSGSGRGSPGPGWVPPEAAAAAAKAADDIAASWACSACTLINAPDAVACEACGHVRPGYTPTLEDAFPALVSTRVGKGAINSVGSSSSSASGAGGQGEQPSAAAGLKKKGKLSGTKITIGIGAGTGRQVAQQEQAPAPNAWGMPAATPELRQQVQSARAALGSKPSTSSSGWASARGPPV